MIKRLVAPLVCCFFLSCGISTTTPIEDGRKYANCFRNATTIEQFEKCERKRDAYIEAYAEKGINYSDMSDFLDEVEKGMTNSKLWEQ